MEMNRRRFGELVLGGLIVGGWRSTARAQRTYDGRGVVRAIRRERRSITIHHEPIDGLMPEMTMPFRLQSLSVLEGVSVGDRVAFTIRQRPRGGYTILTMRRR